MTIVPLQQIDTAQQESEARTQAMMEDFRRSGSHITWLEQWRQAGKASGAASDASDEERLAHDRYEALSRVLCMEQARTPDDLIAQIQWLEEDLGTYVTAAAPFDYGRVFDMLKAGVLAMDGRSES